MGGDIERVVYVLRPPDARDEADALGVGDCVRERLREAGIGGELQNTHLAELVRPEVCAVIGEGRLDGRHHPVHIVGVLRVIVDLDGDVLPVVAPDGIAGREERVEVQDGGIHLVMEVAASVLHPLALQVAGRQCDLVRVGADRRIKVHPVRVVGKVGVAAGVQVRERGHAGAGLQPLFAAVAGVGQLAAGLVADGRKAGVTDAQKRAVAGDARVWRVVGKAALLIGKVECHGHAAARRERLCQMIDVVAVFFVRLCPRRPARERERTDRHLPVYQHMDVRDRLPCLVEHLVGAAHDVLPRRRVEVRLHRNASDARLRQALVALILLLIARLELPGPVRREVVVQHVRVVEDKAAQDDESQHRQGQHGPRAPVPPGQSRPAPLRPIGLRPAHPQQGGQNAQDHRKGRPVEREPEHGLDIRPETVHVRVLQRGYPGKQKQVVFQAKLRQDDAGHQEGEDHQGVPEELMVDEGMDEERQHGEQNERGEDGPVKVGEVEADLEVEIAVARLDKHARDDQDQHQKRLRQHQGGQLAAVDQGCGHGQ